VVAERKRLGDIMSMKTKKIVTTIALNLALLFLAFIWLVPIFWMVLNSFSINDNLFATSFFPPAFSIH
jgi:arabinogalactan oligomer/maltooligosaccharide transport system permease protein